VPRYGARCRHCHDAFVALFRLFEYWSGCAAVFYAYLLAFRTKRSHGSGRVRLLFRNIPQGTISSSSLSRNFQRSLVGLVFRSGKSVLRILLLSKAGSPLRSVVLLVLPPRVMSEYGPVLARVGLVGVFLLDDSVPSGRDSLTVHVSLLQGDWVNIVLLAFFASQVFLPSVLLSQVWDLQSLGRTSSCPHCQLALSRASTEAGHKRGCVCTAGRFSA